MYNYFGLPLWSLSLWLYKRVFHFWSGLVSDTKFKFNVCRYVQVVTYVCKLTCLYQFTFWRVPMTFFEPQTVWAVPCELRPCTKMCMLLRICTRELVPHLSNSSLKSNNVNKNWWLLWKRFTFYCLATYPFYGECLYVRQPNYE